MSKKDDASKKEMKPENKGDHKGSDISEGMTSGMHGKATGGHPTIRAGEFSGKGAGHHTDCGK